MFTKIKNRMKSDEPVKYLFTGDSITHAALHTFGWRDYSEHFSERVRFEMGRVRDFVFKTGISGWTTAEVREDIEWNILQHNPDIVSIMLGMNDCATTREISQADYRDNYNFILDEIEKRNSALVMLHTMNPIWDVAKDLRGRLPEYVEIIREIGKERQLPVVDHYAFWTQKIEQAPDLFNYWMSDSIHPNNFGHIVFAHLLFRELGIFDSASNTCRLFSPGLE